MRAEPQHSGSSGAGRAIPAPALPSLALGLVLGLSYLKWGNPVILDSLVVRPTNPLECLVMAWPVSWGYGCLACAVALVLGWATVGGAATARPWRAVWVGGWKGKALLVLPAAWFGWQCLAALASVDSTLSHAVLPQFAACLLCFYAGWLGLTGAPHPKAFWIPILAGFALMLLNGFEQHYGGLDRTRELIRSQPGWEGLPAEFLRRIESNRIFSTLFYANTLAGLVLLVLPSATWHLWEVGARWPRVVRGASVGMLVYAGLACLYWSGSKAGWLVGAALVALLLWRLLPSGWLRWTVLGLVVTAGLALFVVRFQAYFDKGATSAVARFDCWRAAHQIALKYPALGSGPGTFGVLYKTMKKPEAEMAKLVHNDYLEQVSDSGWVGGALFLGFVGLAIGRRPRTSNPTTRVFLLWLGVFGWALHSFVEFGLYIPAIAWTAFVWLGLLTASSTSGTNGSQS